MSLPVRPTPAGKSETQAVLLAQDTFDYAPLEAEVVRQMQTAAQRIRQLVRRTLEVLIAIGEELLAAKEALPHGSFGPWLRAEFGWTERTARNFMAVALRFGPKTERIADLPIDPTAAYLLAAPSAPAEACEAALRRAEGGERITMAVAEEILCALRKRRQWPRATASAEPPAGKILGQLLESLESFRARWDPRQVSLLARQLREFADSLEEE